MLVKAPSSLRDEIIRVISVLTDDQTTPALRKHVMTKYVGRRQPLSKLEDALARLDAIAQQHSRFDVRQFRALSVPGVDADVNADDCSTTTC